jgi:hypothetical protein
MFSVRNFRYVLAGLGLLIAEGGYWAARPRITAITVVFALVSAVPYFLYGVLVRTRLGSVLGSASLLVLPATAYYDYHFGEFGGVSFAFVTVPMANILIVGIVLLLDSLVARHGQVNSGSSR